MARIYVITGPMFSGKSKELIRQLQLAGHTDMNILVLKPKGDTRANGEICTREKKCKHDTEFKTNSSFPAFEVETAIDAFFLIKKYQPDILGIDEAQFLGSDFVQFFKELHASKGYLNLIVIIAGIDLTSENEPFGSMPAFMALADRVEKLRAVCFRCKEWPPTATMSHFKPGKKDQVAVGDADKYEAVCLTCWVALQP